MVLMLFGNSPVDFGHHVHVPVMLAVRLVRRLLWPSESRISATLLGEGRGIVRAGAVAQAIISDSSAARYEWPRKFGQRFLSRLARYLLQGNSNLADNV